MVIKTISLNNINTNNFDFLRVVFALTVAIVHFIFLSGIDSLQACRAYFNSRLAIDGFFIISGFLIAKSFHKSSSSKNYILKRIKRIFPAYFILIFICAVFLSFLSSYSAENYFLNIQFWKYLLANFSFQNYIEPCLPGVFTGNKVCAVNGALWTIKLEEAFYLLLPVFYWLVNSKKINIYFLSILMYLSSIIYYNYFLENDMYRIAKQLPGAMAFFVSGILLFNNFSYFYKKKKLFILPCIIVFLLEHYVFQIQVLKPIAFSGIVFYIAYSFKFLNNFGKYGDFTYGIYIYHYPIIQILVFTGFYKTQNIAITALITFILILLLAVFSWHYIELPFLSKNRKLRQQNLSSN